MSLTDSFGAGIGGPGMWDPMPLPPPVTPPEPRDEEKLIWSRPETLTPPAAAPASRRPATPKRSPAKAARPKARKPVKKAAKAKRPVKKAAKKQASRARRKKR